MKKLCGTLFLLLLANFAFAQIQKPVSWTVAVKNKKELVFTAYIENGWHIYDLGVSDFGPNPTEFSFEKVNGAQLSGEVISSSPSITVYEELFGMETKYFEGTPKFSQAFKLLDTDGFQIDGYITYSACTKKRCVNLTEEFSFTPEDLISGGVKKSGNENIAAAAPPQETEIKNDLWRPVINELNAFSPQNAAGTSWAGIFLICFGGGFVALLMPCIWPVIPLTVSFFLKHFNKSREKAIAHASFYGISILVIYLVLGLFFTLFFGASALNSLATNAAVNLFFFALLIFFAISFFGLFEIRLPAAWINKINGRAQAATGLLGIFFMAFTLVLVSFSCTGPIIGTLLVQLTTTGNILAPAVGMCGFGLALAIPFTLFAFFPSLMQKMPKSGEWLNTLKIVLGFLELALALKFLSVADLAYHWDILNREVFLVLWILIFISLGFYLLKMKNFSFRRLFAAALPLAFAAYMIPGLWGAPLKDISAFLPPLHTQSFNLYGNMLEPKFYDYEEGMAYAARVKKPVMIDFTGYGCVNCRKMEAAVLSDLRVKEIIDNEYILISLYVDDKKPLSEIIEKEEYGKKIKLRTVGDKWSYFQRYKFGANAQPFYVLLDNGGSPLAPWYAYDENIDNFIDYLKSGIKE